MTSKEALEAAGKFLTVAPKDGRFVIAVGEGLVDNPIYDLWNTEQSANDTAAALVVAIATAIDAHTAKAILAKFPPIPPCYRCGGAGYITHFGRGADDGHDIDLTCPVCNPKYRDYD